MACLAGAFAALALLCTAGPARSLTLPPPLAPRIDTTIDDGPADEAVIEDERPSFSFSAARDGAAFPGAVFQCSVDEAPTQPCTSPLQLGPLAEGPHVFSVLAEDPEDSSADPDPARRSFFVDLEGEEECEEFEEEDGLVEEGEGCAEEEASPLPPEECLLRTARARVFTYSSQDRIRLVIRYTSFSPADVSVDFRLAGGKGPLNLGSARQRFARKGLFRLTEKLTDSEAEKVRAARRFTVTMEIPEAPRYCRRYGIRRLTVKRTVHSQVIWFQSDSVFGTSP